MARVFLPLLSGAAFAVVLLGVGCGQVSSNDDAQESVARARLASFIEALDVEDSAMAVSALSPRASDEARALVTQLSPADQHQFADRLRSANLVELRDGVATFALPADSADNQYQEITVLTAEGEEGIVF